MISNTSLSAFSAGIGGIGPAILPPTGPVRSTTISDAPQAPARTPPSQPGAAALPPSPNLPRGSLLDLSV